MPGAIRTGQSQGILATGKRHLLRSRARMAATKEAPVFLDTSIQIARWVHSDRVKKHIKQRIDQHERIVTGLVVRQEFRRRLLKEAEYLLRLLYRYNSFDEVYHHVIRLPGTWHERK